MESDEEKVILTIDGEKFDVTNYISVHPGEGHNNIFLEDFHGKDVFLFLYKNQSEKN